LTDLNRGVRKLLLIARVEEGLEIGAQHLKGIWRPELDRSHRSV
jgi:hypothetical protein